MRDLFNKIMLPSFAGSSGRDSKSSHMNLLGEDGSSHDSVVIQQEPGFINEMESSDPALLGKSSKGSGVDDQPLDMPDDVPHDLGEDHFDQQAK